MKTVLNRLFPVFSALLLTLPSGCEKKPPKTPAPPSVIVERAPGLEFAGSTLEIGEVQAYDKVDLVAEVSGFLTEVNFREGESVKKGTKLFQIEAALYEAAVQKAEGDLLKEKANRENADIEYARQKKLLEKDATAKRNFDLAKMKRDEAAARIISAEAVLAEKKVDLAYTKVLAPFDGVVGFKKYSAGNLVGKTSGALATITRSGDVKIFFSINEYNLLRLMRLYPGAMSGGAEKRKSGKQMPGFEIFFQDGVKYEHNGRIAAWDNAIGDGAGTFRIQGVCPNPDSKLLHGMYVKVKLQIEPKTKHVMVRQESIRREQLGNFVFVVGADGTVERRKVKLGLQSEDRCAVTEGLKEGELVVVAGIQKARPGSKVKAVEKSDNQPAVSASEPAAVPAPAPVSKSAVEPAAKK